MKNKLFLLLIVSWVFMSCDELIDVTPKGKYTTDNYFVDDQSLIDAVTGVYAQLLQNEFLGLTYPKWDICSDDLYRSGDHAFDAAIETFTFDAANTQIAWTWSRTYELAARANNILVFAKDKTTFSSDILKRSIGEVYFLRAFTYWALYLPFGEIPLIIEEDVLNKNYNKPKSTVPEVLAQIEKDLKASLEYLNTTETDGRVHQGAAYAYLTQLYMHWSCIAGLSDAERNAKLNAAIEYGEKITGNTLYKLTDTYLENFRQVTTGTSELLFYMPSNQWRNNMWLNYFNNRSLGGWGFWQPLKGLYDSYNPNDIRKSCTLLKEGVDLMTASGSDAVFDKPTVTGYQFCKYLKLKDGLKDDNLIIPLMRSADIYLLVAEAKIRLNGNGAGDAEINAVRKRTGLPDISNAGKDELMLERRHELAGEVRRHFDMVRWDKIGWVDLETLYSLDISMFEVDKGIRKFTRPRNYYFPLPQGEIDKSKGVLIQNSEYTH